MSPEEPPSPEQSTAPDDIRRETALLWGRVKAWLWLAGGLAIAFALARLTGFV